MSYNKEKLNDFLVDIFHSILKIEEDALKKGDFSDLSLNKMHIIEELCKMQTPNMSTLAEKLDVTIGTLTVAVNSLVSKDYITRIKDPNDKRVVSLKPTKKGLLANAQHQKFHENMVDGIISALTDDEITHFAKGVQTISDHFNKINLQNKGE